LGCTYNWGPWYTANSNREALFRPKTSINYVSSFFKFPPEYLANRIPSDPNVTEIFPFEGRTLDDPNYPAWSEKAVDLRSRIGNSHSRISNDVSKGTEKSREANHLLVKANVQKEVLYGTRAVPENLEGAWL